MLTGILYHLLTTALFILVGYKITMIKDVFSYEKWIKMSGRDKISLLCSTISLAISFATFFYICYSL